MLSENYLIYTCILVIFVSTVPIGIDIAGASTDEGSTSEFKTQSQLPFSERKQLIQPTSGITVITGHPANRLVAFTSGGRVLYYDDSFKRYHDVDPSPVGSKTVEVVTGEDISPEKTEMAIQQINLTTGETQILYSRMIPRDDIRFWHDVDRIDSHRFIVADIQRDSVFIINTTTQERTYTWNAQTEYSLSGGGSYPTDWTHMNDVEVLDDGRIMVSLRNQDQVVFLQPGEGMLEDQTLGAENQYDTLYEQHNPDYIPEERGGPAILVADSQNNRVVEYQRQNGSWMQSWEWSDPEMQWPRDADRLPNGNTLIADSNSRRILEVNESGDIVWQISGISNYDVERLGTGEESSGGYSARELNLSSSTVQTNAQSSTSNSNSNFISTLSINKRTLYLILSSILPNKATNAIGFIAPNWLSSISILALAVDSVAGVCLIGLVFRRSSYSLQLPIAQKK